MPVSIDSGMQTALQADDLAATEATSASESTTAPAGDCQRQRLRQSSGGGGGGCNSDDGEDDGCGFALDGVDLAPMSTLELLSSGSGKTADFGGGRVEGRGVDIGDGDYRGEPDPPTVLIDSEAGPPTAKQRRVARIVMAVAFALLAMCVILIGVTLSMSDQVDEMDKQRRLAEQEKSGTPSAKPT